MPDDKARKLWAQYYKVNYQKMKDGYLQESDTKLLNEHVATKCTDTMRDNFVPTLDESEQIMERVYSITSKNPEVAKQHIADVKAKLKKVRV